MDSVLVLLQGFFTGLGLIMVIGAQNAFILRNGVAHNHVFLIATVSLLGDVFLIILGINGLGAFVQRSEVLQLVMVIGGSAFLITYGGMAFISAWKKRTLNMQASENLVAGNVVKVILLALGFSVLNPHAWLDAAIILGSIGGQLDDTLQRHLFTAGAIVASATWFYALGFAASRLSPYLRQPRVWQIINILIGLMMWGIATNLIFDYLY